MTFRDDDDDTSRGRFTQGGHKARSGHAIWLVLLAVVAAVAAVVWIATPRGAPKPSKDGTASTLTPSRPVAPAGTTHVAPPPIR